MFLIISTTSMLYVDNKCAGYDGVNKFLDFNSFVGFTHMSNL